MSEENKKMRLEFEFDRDEVAGTMMLMGNKLTEERWAKLTEAPISMDFDMLGEDSTQIQIAIVALAIASSGIE